LQVLQYVSVPGTPQEPVADEIEALNDVMAAVAESQQ
jgi:hypothetical protein